MPRRAAAQIRPVEADPIHRSKLVQQVINKVMLDGKKSTAERIVYDALALLGERSDKDPVETLEASIKALTPTLEVKSRRVGGATYQVPVEVASSARPHARRALARRVRPPAPREDDGPTPCKRAHGRAVPAGRRVQAQGRHLPHGAGQQGLRPLPLVAARGPARYCVLDRSCAEHTPLTASLSRLVLGPLPAGGLPARFGTARLAQGPTSCFLPASSLRRAYPFRPSRLHSLSTARGFGETPNDVRSLTDPLKNEASVPKLSVPNVFFGTTTDPGFHPEASDRIEPYVWKIAGVVILGMIMSILDTTIVNVALHTLARSAQLDRPGAVGDHRLSAVAGRRDPGDRLGRAALRRKACVHDLARAVHRSAPRCARWLARPPSWCCSACCKGRAAA